MWDKLQQHRQHRLFYMSSLLLRSRPKLRATRSGHQARSRKKECFWVYQLRTLRLLEPIDAGFQIPRYLDFQFQIGFQVFLGFSYHQYKSRGRPKHAVKAREDATCEYSPTFPLQAYTWWRLS